MRAELREYDFLARYAGDEFVAIVPDTAAGAMQELCERMEKAVLGFRLPIGDGRHAQVGVSIGSASYTGSGETLDQVIIAADQAMYSVKATHKQKNKPQPKAETPVAAEPLQTFDHVEIVPQEIKINEESFVLELDESHIVSNAVN